MSADSSIDPRERPLSYQLTQVVLHLEVIRKTNCSEILDKEVKIIKCGFSIKFLSRVIILIVRVLL
jgi:hypothetical protein